MQAHPIVPYHNEHRCCFHHVGSHRIENNFVLSQLDGTLEGTLEDGTAERPYTEPKNEHYSEPWKETWKEAWKQP